MAEGFCLACIMLQYVIGKEETYSFEKKEGKKSPYTLCKALACSSASVAMYILARNKPAKNGSATR